MIYFVRDTLSSLIKIGCTKNPWARLAKMQSDCPGSLVLAGVIDGDERDEAALHEVCRSARERGEWFREEGAVIAALASARPHAHVVRDRDPRVELIAVLAAATGVPKNASRAWLDRGRIPAGHMLAIDRAGILTLEQMSRAAAVNNGLGRGDPLAVRLEDLACRGAHLEAAA